MASEMNVARQPAERKSKAFQEPNNPADSDKKDADAYDPLAHAVHSIARICERLINFSQQHRRQFAAG
jgi:hypothetical protein